MIPVKLLSKDSRRSNLMMLLHGAMNLAVARRFRVKSLLKGSKRQIDNNHLQFANR